MQMFPVTTHTVFISQLFLSKKTLSACWKALRVYQISKNFILSIQNELRIPNDTCPILRMLSTETLLEILRHFTRKELSQIFYLVNRQFHQLATSLKHMPAIHNIQEILFSSPNHIQRGRPNTITIASPYSGDGYCGPYTVDQLVVPGPFIRFRQVYIHRTQPETTVKFMEEIKESFIGCKLHSSIPNKKHLCYLLDNVFHSQISIKLTPMNWMSGTDLIHETKGMLNCNKLELHWHNRFTSFLPINGLFNWLRANGTQGGEFHLANKHLILVHYPCQVIQEVVQQIRQDFENKIPTALNCVITFVECAENHQSLEEEDFFEFTLDDKPTGQRLSLFKHHEVVGQISDRAYRLWHRRVDNETSDARILSCLQNRIEFGPVAEFDNEFYSFDYPMNQDID
ncbi:hypothetical protein DdX_12935 [Ditylenchus destructor]|uniref:F-box domain-containing protein n=1 Tax=Ditylenchus destructor TaxID=166010 RepID=A0AAD4MWT1_9BILA|nr:hypothetical protein DdX_12935 [Ditylenchus destructor]